jgi:hypothetical protein
LFLLLSAAIGIGLLVGCGPSEADIATQTASAWTATPLPTATATPSPTPTPIPYDVSLQILDPEGNPVVGSEVVLIELEESQGVDQDGVVSWSDLPGEAVSFAVSAQGYLSGEFSQTLDRGSNELSHQLELDPFGLLPTSACLPEEELLYIEDFQDGLAQGWPEAEAQAGWKVVELEDGNPLLAGNESGVTTRLQGQTFDNAVWRLRFMYDGEANPNLLWRDVNSAAYQIGLLTRSIGPGGLTRYSDGNYVGVGNWFFNPTVGEWYQLEISTLDGVTSLWLDGEELMRPYADPDPWPAGGIGIEPWVNEGSTIYYDDFSVCGLNGPFATLYAPPVGE